MNLLIIIPLILYLIIILGTAYYAYSKRKQGDFIAEYYIGNREMNGFILAMTTAATYVSAGSFIGGPGAAYKFGLGWVLLAMIQVPTVWLALGALGKKFALLARETNAITLNDLLMYRYNHKGIIWISCVALLISLFAAMTAQFIGGARLLEASIGISYNHALFIFAATVSIYTFIGGFRAIILTDVIQGSIMMVGSIILLIAIIYNIGSIELAVEKLTAIDPDLVTPFGPNNILDLPFMASFWVLVCFGVVGLPPTAIRCMSYKNSKSLHVGMIIGTIVISIMMFAMHLSGILGRVLIPDLTIPDQIIPILMLQVLPPVVVGLFLAAPMSAIMATIDAQLIQSSATLIKDIYLNAKPEEAKNERKIKWLSTGSTLLISVLLIFAAMNPPDMLIWISLMAIGALESTFLWVIILGLYWDKANAYGAIASMLVGLLSFIYLTHLNIELLSFKPIIPALTFSLIAFITCNKFGELKSSQPINL